MRREVKRAAAQGGNDSGDGVRAAKEAIVARLRASGEQPYVDRYEVTHTCEAASQLPDGERVAVAGRLMLWRAFGSLVFATIQDRSGQLQISLKKQDLGERFGKLEDILHTGDFVGIRGLTWTTQKGQKTVNAESATLLSKSVRALPDKWNGVVDTELQYRKRYLHLLTDEKVRLRFLNRAAIVNLVRSTLNDAGFVEVETPVLIPAASGASARPFVTHHNALNEDFYLRISPETYLKRLVAGGLERVYELGRQFRNEGMDPSHLQEFTMVEWYAAYWNYRDNMRFTSALIKKILLEVNKSEVLDYRGLRLDFSGDWPEYDYRDLVKEKTGIDLRVIRDAAALKEEITLKRIDIGRDVADVVGYGALVDLLYKKTVRPSLIQPCFLVNHPAELVPLARPNDDDPTQLDMYQVVVNSWEVVKAYSELVDPALQRRLLEEQMSLREKGDDESMMLEEDFLECMEVGMPPISGVGMGIDRIVSLFTGQENLRDVVLFPTVRRQ